MSNLDIVQDNRLFGLFPQFRAFLDLRQVVQATSDLVSITRGDVKQMLQRVPKEWDVSREARRALVDLVVRRADYVAETIVQRLKLQRLLLPEDDSENSQS